MPVEPAGPADWKQLLTWSLAFFNGAVTAFIGSERLRGPGGSMPPVSTGLLVVSAALLTASLVFSVLFIVQHPSVKYWRYWTVPLAVAAAALVGFRFYRDLTAFGQGVLLGVGGLLLLEGVRRLVVGYYLRKKMRRESEKAEEEARRAAEAEAAEAAAEVQRALVPEEVLDRLRQIHTRCVPAFEKVIDLLSTLCSGKQKDIERSQAALLLITYVVQPLCDKTETLAAYFHIPRPMNKTEFIDLKTTFRDVISKYIEAGSELGRMGCSFADDESLATKKYNELVKANAACLDALEETVGTHYFGDITASHLALMRTRFPRPD